MNSWEAKSLLADLRTRSMALHRVLENRMWPTDKETFEELAAAMSALSDVDLYPERERLGLDALKTGEGLCMMGRVWKDLGTPQGLARNLLGALGTPTAAPFAKELMEGLNNIAGQLIFDLREMGHSRRPFGHCFAGAA